MPSTDIEPTADIEPAATISSFRERARVVLRGAMGRCPQCGKGALLHRYLKVMPACAHCGEKYGHISADDMPPWLTILIVGHLLVPEVWYVQRNFDLPLWVEQLLWPSLALVLILILLPRCKGACVAILWMLPRLPDRKRRASAPKDGASLGPEAAPK